MIKNITPYIVSDERVRFANLKYFNMAGYFEEEAEVINAFTYPGLEYLPDKIPFAGPNGGNVTTALFNLTQVEGLPLDIIEKAKDCASQLVAYDPELGVGFKQIGLVG